MLTNRPGNLLSSTFTLGAPARGTKCLQQLLLSNAKCVCMLGSETVYSICQAAATSRKWTHTVQNGRVRRAISVWGSGTEYEYKHTHATSDVHHAGTHVLTLGMCALGMSAGAHTSMGHAHKLLSGKTDYLPPAKAQRHTHTPGPRGRDRK